MLHQYACFQWLNKSLIFQVKCVVIALYLSALRKKEKEKLKEHETDTWTCHARFGLQTKAKAKGMGTRQRAESGRTTKTKR